MSPFYLFFLLFSSAISCPSPQIHQACNATRHPSLCESSLSNSTTLPPNQTPIDLILECNSISSSMTETAISKMQSVLDSSAGNINLTIVAKACLEGLGYSVHRINSASLAIAGGGGGDGVADARAWISAALLYHSGCWSGLKKVNDNDQVADAMTFILSLTNHTSNALSMVAALQRYGNDTALWAPPQTERDGYWGGEGTTGVAGLGSQPGVPTNLVPNVKVCKQGCEFDTVQAAVDSTPDNKLEHYVIYIMEGVYQEIVRIPFNKTNVVFIGDGMGKTVITGNLSADMVGLTTYTTATVGVSGDGFMASNITFGNTAGPDSHQAVAFRSDSDRSILENVEFLGHQDTLYVHALRQLYKSCNISGTVDFIFGNSAAVFENCTILIVPRQLNPANGETNTVTAHGRTDPGQATGFVFNNCLVNGSAEYWNYYLQKPANHKSYLGRPWKEYSRTVFIDCYLEKIIRPEGWLPWDGTFALTTLFYGEFESEGPGANVSARVPWSNKIPAEHVNVYSVQNFIQIS